VTEKLGYRKLCAHFVPKMLTITKQMGSALKFLTRYAREGDEFLDSIMTGDETGFSPHSWIQAITFCVEKSYERTHLAFGKTLERRCHFKHVSLKQSRFYHEHGSQVKDRGRWQYCHNKHKIFPYRPTRDISLLSWHASYQIYWCLLKKMS